VNGDAEVDDTGVPNIRIEEWHLSPEMVRGTRLERADHAERNAPDESTLKKVLNYAEMTNHGRAMLNELVD